MIEMPTNDYETGARATCRLLQVDAGIQVHAVEKDVVVPQKVDRYRRSRLSALKWGVELNEILPSRGAKACVYASRCDLIKTPSGRRQCKAGEECPAERRHFDAYVDSARRQFAIAREALDPIEFESIIRQLALLDLRKMRLSARRRDEGMTRRVRRRTKDGDYSEMEELTLSHSRYWKAVDRRFQAILDRLLRPDAPT